MKEWDAADAVEARAPSKRWLGTMRKRAAPGAMAEWPRCGRGVKCDAHRATLQGMAGFARISGRKRQAERNQLWLREIHSLQPGDETIPTLETKIT